VDESELFNKGDGRDGNGLDYGVSDAPSAKKNMVKGRQWW